MQPHNGWRCWRSLAHQCFAAVSHPVGDGCQQTARTGVGRASAVDGGVAQTPWFGGDWGVRRLAKAKRAAHCLPPVGVCRVEMSSSQQGNAVRKPMNDAQLKAAQRVRDYQSKLPHAHSRPRIAFGTLVAEVCACARRSPCARWRALMMLVRLYECASAVARSAGAVAAAVCMGARRYLVQRVRARRHVPQRRSTARARALTQTWPCVQLPHARR